MTLKAQDYLKSNFFTFANFVIMVTLFFKMGAWSKEQDVDALNLTTHTINKEVHIQRQDVINITEIKTSLEQMKDDIDEIKTDIKELIKNN